MPRLPQLKISYLPPIDTKAAPHLPLCMWSWLHIKPQTHKKCIANYAKLFGKESTRRPWFNSWVGKIPWRRDRLPTPVSLGFPGGSDGKESTHNIGNLGSIPGLGRSPGGGHGNPLHYSCLENPHGQRSLAAYNPWGCKQQDTTELLNTHFYEISFCKP